MQCLSQATPLPPALLAPGTTNRLALDTEEAVKDSNSVQLALTALLRTTPLAQPLVDIKVVVVAMLQAIVLTALGINTRVKANVISSFRSF